jgi:hypothetical protein
MSTAVHFDQLSLSLLRMTAARQLFCRRGDGRPGGSGSVTTCLSAAVLPVLLLPKLAGSCSTRAGSPRAVIPALCRLADSCSTGAVNFSLIVGSCSPSCLTSAACQELFYRRWESWRSWMLMSWSMLKRSISPRTWPGLSASPREWGGSSLYFRFGVWTFPGDFSNLSRVGSWRGGGGGIQSTIIYNKKANLASCNIAVNTKHAKVLSIFTANKRIYKHSAPTVCGSEVDNCFLQGNLTFHISFLNSWIRGFQLAKNLGGTTANEMVMPPPENSFIYCVKLFSVWCRQQTKSDSTKTLLPLEGKMQRRHDFYPLGFSLLRLEVGWAPALKEASEMLRPREKMARLAFSFRSNSFCKVNNPIYGIYVLLVCKSRKRFKRLD